MSKAAKEFVNAMSRGWKKCPKMVGDSFYEGEAHNPTACCANGHAALGMYGNAQQWNGLDFAYTQQVKLLDGTTEPLTYALDKLVQAGWTTPQIAKWIRSNIK